MFGNSLSFTYRGILLCPHWCFTIRSFRSTHRLRVRPEVMATTSESKYSETDEKSTSSVDEEREPSPQAGWKALFGFTTTSHIAILISALASAAAAAAILPIFSVIYGLVFGAYSDYGSGKVNGDQLMSTVTRLSLIMTGVAAANWVFNSIFFSLFLLFGELQAKSARNRMFDVLIRKDIEWFDRRESGIAALLPTIQTYVKDYWSASMRLKFSDIFAISSCQSPRHLVRESSASLRQLQLWVLRSTFPGA